MPIDRDPDEPGRHRNTHTVTDGPVAPDVPGARGPNDGPRNQAFRERQLAAHAEYLGDVDATYHAHEARQAWAEAVPQLRAAWAEHKEKYPERPHASPSTQPDGGWVADGGRRLTPEQNAEAAKACTDLRDEADQVILPAMRRVETASPDGHLAGLENMVKGEDRLKEKIADELLAKPERPSGKPWTKSRTPSGSRSATRSNVTLKALCPT